MFNFSSIRRFVLIAVAATLTGCTIHPPGEREERASASRLGKPFEKRFEVRDIPPLSDNPTPDEIVERGLLTNADLEQRYWTWRAAIEQIPQDGTQSSSLNIAAGTTVTNGHASWKTSTLTFGNDPMTDIKWPGKLDAAARQTLENARASGHRFVKAKFDLRSKILSAYYDYALNAELIRLEQSNEQLLELTASTTASRNRAGSAGQLDVLKANNEVDLSRNEIANMQSQIPSQVAALNAMLGRANDAPLPLPAELPLMRTIAYQDAELLSLASRNNPELIALADEARGRQQGIWAAKLQYVPDFNLSVGTDPVGIAQSILGQVTVPIFRYEAINAAIAQAEANLRASEAMRRQTGSDLSAQVVADLTAVKDADRQLDLFEHLVLPRAQQAVDLGRSSYETGHASLLDLLDSQRSLVAIERLVANLRANREKHIFDLEAIATIDLSGKISTKTVLNFQ